MYEKGQGRCLLEEALVACRLIKYCISYIISKYHQSQSPYSSFSSFYSILELSSFYFDLLASFFYWLFAFLFRFLLLFFKAVISLSLTASVSYWTIRHYSDDLAQDLEHVKTKRLPQSRFINFGESSNIFYVIWSSRVNLA